MLNDKTVLVTGGTGSFGKKFIKTIFEKYDLKKVIVYSRDELKQFEMQHSNDFEKYDKENRIRFFIGDVRDLARLKLAMENLDIVVHAAALKQIPACEYNPFEAIKTNVLGGQNVIDACLACGVQKVIALSTDKACAPINVYGATKLVSDKIFIAANHYKGSKDITFSVVRYGNVMGSRGSVIPFFLKNRKEGFLPITHKNMTRFNITLEDSIKMVLYALENALGGEIFVTKIPSYKIIDLAKAIAPDCKLKVVGIRPGEKLHEEMITENDSLNTIEMKNYFAILPSTSQKQKYLKHNNAKPVEIGFNYNSGTNDQWVSVEEMRELIKKHVDPNFSVKY